MTRLVFGNSVNTDSSFKNNSEIDKFGEAERSLAASEIRERIAATGGAKKLLNPERLYKGIGALVSNDMSIDEQLSKAKLDWGVGKSAIRYGEMFEYADTAAQAIYREDNGQLLTTTSGDRWTPFQNEEIVTTFNQFCNDGGIEIERLGSLKGGKLIFASAIANESFDVLNSGDALAARVILTNSHEYGKGLTVKLNAIRLVCCNGLTQTVKVGFQTISHRAAFSEIQVREILEKSKTSFAEFAQTAQDLAQIQISNSEAHDLLITSQALRGDRDKSLEDQPRIIQKAYSNFVNDTATGGNLESAHGTAWGLVNAVTEHVNHDSNVRGGVETHINSLWYGTKANTQQSFVTHVISSIDFANQRAAQKHLQREAQAVRAF
jgi:phage/plasmid-like protein (TIGR03299 family)